MFFKKPTPRAAQEEQKEQDPFARLRQALDEADAVVIGAGAGLSTSAGFVYGGARFERYFSDFAAQYGFDEMYSGGFYPYETPEEMWAYWSRYIYVNRYMDPPKPVYEQILALVKDKDYFVLTTNVDHCFQKAGFDKKRLFYTQGDYGLFQCSEPCCKETFDNEEMIRRMVAAQGFTFGPGGELLPPEEPGALLRRVPTSLVPTCPHCGKPLTMNLRSDDKFVQDAGWDDAAERYSNFLRTRGDGRVLFLELGVGYNTPSIIKYPFWQMTYRNHEATYACLNFGQAYTPQEIAKRAICIDGDIGETLGRL
jgi:NAD-dependent SIR2 family protein deacetylase